MKRSFLGLVVILLSMLLVGAIQAPAVTQAEPLQDPDVDQAVETALLDAVQQNRVQVLGFLLYDVQVDHIDYSADGNTALVWLALVDPQTGEVLATEPGLSIARNLQNGDPTLAQSWSMTLNSASDWISQVENLPVELLTEDVRMRYLTDEQISLAVVQPVNPDIVFRGYKLPWAQNYNNPPVRLTGSLGHIYTYKSCESTCRYAFDFANTTMFPLLAAKGGTVKQFKWTCANGDPYCTNYVILEDQSTTPVSYQVYYHMAYNTLPERLRTLGARVLQGESVGNVDDTGASTGHHLHYHVYVTPTRAWEWGYSVDIRFDDVPINDGRPRTCKEARDFPNEGAQCMVGPDGKALTADDDRFVSGNVGAYPPQGEISAPAPGASNFSSSFTVTGTTSDDQGVTKVQVLGEYNGVWNNLGDASLNANGTFSKVVDVCQAKMPMGSIQLALRIFDREGNQALGYPGQRTFNNQHLCYTPPPPPVCNPGANEVALYNATDFLGSACKKFAIGSYDSSQLGSLGNNTASSIQVGANVRAILYDFSQDLNEDEVLSRIENFEASDTSLADNWIGDNHVSAVWVQARAIDASQASQLEPFLTDVGNTDGAEIFETDSLVLAWEGGEGANQFRSDIRRQGETTPIRSLDWQYVYNWSIGNLPAGSYRWTVTARNSVYPTVTNSTDIDFSVVAGSLPVGSEKTAPFGLDFESDADAAGWHATGLWRRDSVAMGNRDQTKAWMFNDGVNYEDAVRRGGDLTSPVITLPAGAEYYLRFKSYADIEDGNPYWDQRRVQLSIDNGPFFDLYQFMDDKQEGPVWITSSAIKLVNPSGQAISNSQVRVRFHFNAIDEDYNNQWGWMIDDVSVTTTPPDMSCADGSNTSDQALPITIGKSINAVICPQGDVDYFSFQGRAGQVVQFDVDANPGGLSVTDYPGVSLLDSYLFLLDSTGKNVVMENDDEIPNSAIKDSRLTYILQRDGVYYVKVRAWDHPGAGGPQFFYTIKSYAMMGDIRQIYLPLASR